MKILVIGGSKFIGKHISSLALRQNHSVTLFNRGETPHRLDVEQIIGDVDNILASKEEILKHSFDVAIHCIAYTEKHAHDLVEIFRGTNTHVIVLSSCDCYEAFQGLNRQKDLSDIPLKETSEISSKRYYWSDSKAKGKYTEKYDKNLVTDILLDSAKSGQLRTTIFRLPMVYGPEDYQYQGRHGAIIQRILDEEQNIIFTDREQCQTYTFGYVENISAAIIHSFGRQDCYTEVFNLGEEYSRSLRRWASLYEEYCGWKFNVHILPEELVRRDQNYRNAPPQLLVIDSTKYRTITGFKDPISLEESIKRTFEYARTNTAVLGETPNYTEENELVEKYYSLLDSMY